MITVEENTLKQLHDLLLEALVELDRICRKNGIRYSLSGGSMLGAVRHKGFIPWDDDVDVTMLHADYNKFIEVCKTELDTKRFFLQTVETDEEYKIMFARLLINGTSYVREGREEEKAKNGVFIDIFSRDNISDNDAIAYIQQWLSFFMRKILYADVGYIKSKNLYQKCAYRILKLFKKEHALKLYDIILKLNGEKETEYVWCYGIMSYKEKRRATLNRKEYKKFLKSRRGKSFRDVCIRREYLEEMIDVEFEGHVFKITKFYDIWLTMVYGDYMKLPPAEQQIPHHFASMIKLRS